MCSDYFRRLKTIFVPTNLTLQSTSAPPRRVEPSSDGVFSQCQNLWLQSSGSDCFTTQSRSEKGRVWRKGVCRVGPGPQGPGLCRAGAQLKGCYTTRSSALLPFALHPVSQHDSPIPASRSYLAKGRQWSMCRGCVGCAVLPQSASHCAA